MTKKELENKKEIARLYYMQGETQRGIALKLGITEQSLSKWTKEGKWQLKRAAINITRPELVNKTLLLIGGLLDKISESENPLEETKKNTDALIKLTSTIEKLDKKTNLVTVMEICSSFERYLVNRSKFDKEVTKEFIIKVNEYQQYYIDDFSALDKE